MEHDINNPKYSEPDITKRIVNFVIGVLEPEIVVFLSKKAFKYYNESQVKTIPNLKIEAVAHPTCAWWFRDNGKYGKMEFQNIIEKAISK